MGILLVAEHDGTRLRNGSKSALGLALELATPTSEPVELLVIGANLDTVAADATQFGATIVADHPCLAHPTADRYAQLIAEVAKARSLTTLIAADTTFSKDILPRTAALLDAAMASGVTGYSRSDGEGELLWRRPVYAGAALATVTLAPGPCIITVRASAFHPASPRSESSNRVDWPVNPATLPGATEFVAAESRATARPDLTEARVVISGGRPFRSAEEFEEHVGGLADALHGAAGCTRALVDAGIAPNEWQVGQTGKVVAPDLYIALGVSGALQHLAGMKNSRCVVAINSDPDAPIFSAANYGLVGDVRRIVPELIRELRQ